MMITSWNALANGLECKILNLWYTLTCEGPSEQPDEPLSYTLLLPLDLLGMASNRNRTNEIKQNSLPLRIVQGNKHMRFFGMHQGEG